MKKKIKRFTTGVCLLAACSLGFYIFTRPMETGLTEVLLEDAVLYFTEEGVVTGKNTVAVLSLAQGAVLAVYVEENQHVKTGDILCEIDVSDYHYEIAQIQSNIQGYEGQILHLHEETARQNATLGAEKNHLLAQLAVLDSQETSAAVTVDEQAALQYIVIEQNEKNLNAARTDLEKAQILYTSGVISQKEYENTQNRVDNLEQTLQQSKQQLTVIQNGNGQIQTSEEYYQNMKQTLQAQIDGIDQLLGTNYNTGLEQYYRSLIDMGTESIGQLNNKTRQGLITSPIDGVVTQLYVKDVNAVAAQSPVAFITADMEKTVETYLSTREINQVALGDEVILVLKRQQGNLEFYGAITAIGEEAVEMQSVLGVLERRVKLEITPEAAMLSHLQHGYDVDVQITTYKANNVLTIPKTALFTVGNQDMVWQVKSGKLKQTPVETTMTLRTHVVIEGLVAGDIVVTDANQDGLQEGKKVKSGAYES